MVGLIFFVAPYPEDSLSIKPRVNPTEVDCNRRRTFLIKKKVAIAGEHFSCKRRHASTKRIFKTERQQGYFSRELTVKEYNCMLPF